LQPQKPLFFRGIGQIRLLSLDIRVGTKVGQRKF
jgi:hypothetical protein